MISSSVAIKKIVATFLSPGSKTIYPFYRSFYLLLLVDRTRFPFLFQLCMVAILLLPTWFHQEIKSLLEGIEDFWERTRCSEVTYFFTREHISVTCNIIAIYYVISRLYHCMLLEILAIRQALLMYFVFVRFLRVPPNQSTRNHLKPFTIKLFVYCNKNVKGICFTSSDVVISLQ